MTVKQVIVGTLLGATAVAVLMHRMPKATALAMKPSLKHDDRSTRANPRTSRKQASEERLSLNKLG